MRLDIGESVLELIKSDITQEHVDGIGNAANSRLAGGGGVDGAIHRRGGPAIMEDCRRIGGCPTGQAVMTTAGDLHARYVLHCVGPVWRGGESGESELLASCYRNALALARHAGLQSVTFPSISTGIYGYPVELAAGVALGTVKEFMEEGGEPKLVRFVLFDDRTLAAYERELAKLL